MIDRDLDAVYTRICQTMTRLGEEQAPLFLARFALLAIDRMGEAATAHRLIDAAEEGLGAPEAG